MKSIKFILSLVFVCILTLIAVYISNSVFSQLNQSNALFINLSLFFAGGQNLLVNAYLIQKISSKIDKYLRYKP